MVTSNRIHQWAEEILRRVSPEGPWVVRHRLRRALALMRRLGLALLAMSAVLFAACLMALFFTPLGLKGLLVTPLLMLAVGGIVLFWPARRTPAPETLMKVDLAALPLRIAEWLDSERAGFPAAPGRALDSIGQRLQALAPQLRGLNPNDPLAGEVRKLVGKELPDLVRNYGRLPHDLRQTTQDAFGPDRQLLQGLNVVDAELGRIAQRLASGDLKDLEIQGHYLELKYKREA